jgi:hypothetical protein
MAYAAHYERFEDDGEDDGSGEFLALRCAWRGGEAGER